MHNRREEYRFDDRNNRGDYRRDWDDRASDEVRSWFGDDDARRRRDMDERYESRRNTDDRTDHYRTDNNYNREDVRYNTRYGDRDWSERAGDEVRSWFGDDDARRRRDMDDFRRGDDRGWRQGNRSAGEMYGGALGWRNEHEPDRYDFGRRQLDSAGYSDRYIDMNRDDRRDSARNDYRDRGDYGSRSYGESNGRSYGGRRDWDDRASDEVRSWFGDDDARHRRNIDERRNDRYDRR